MKARWRTAPSISYDFSRWVVARVVRMATWNLVPFDWLSLQSVVAMKLDFELGIAHKAGCTVRLVGVVVDQMTVGLDFPLWV